MNILQSTFEKHKKLMLENLGVINETELYHSTSKDRAEKIKLNGPDLSLSGQNFGGAGKSQGSGFYFYKSKERALRHAKENKGEVILVFDQDVNSDVFDIDYEADYNLAGKYLQDNIDFLKANQDKLGITVYNNNMIGLNKHPEFGNKTLRLNNNDVNVLNADLIAAVFQNLQKFDKAKFDAFENAFLKVAKVVKYNGEKKIFPVRIEDLEGNTIWKADNK